jgi:hypothetical protein
MRSFCAAPARFCFVAVVFLVAASCCVAQSPKVLPDRFEVRINVLEDPLVPCNNYTFARKGLLQGLPEVCCPPNTNAIQVKDCKQRTDFERQADSNTHDDSCWELNAQANWICKSEEERTKTSGVLVCCVEQDLGTCVVEAGVDDKAAEGVKCAADMVWTGKTAKECPPGFENEPTCCSLRAASCYDQSLILQGLDVRLTHADTHTMKKKLDITKPFDVYYNWPTFTNNSWSDTYFGAERALDFDPSTYWCTRPVEYFNPDSGELLYFFNDTLPSRWVIDLNRPMNISGIDVVWKFPARKFDVYASSSHLPRSVDHYRNPVAFADLDLGDEDGLDAYWVKVYSEDNGIGREMLQPLQMFEAREIAFVFYDALETYDGCKTGQPGTQPLVAVSEFNFYGENGEHLNTQKPFIQGAEKAETVFHVRDPCEWDGIDCKLAKSTEDIVPFETTTEELCVSRILDTQCYFDYDKTGRLNISRVDLIGEAYDKKGTVVHSDGLVSTVELNDLRLYSKTPFAHEVQEYDDSFGVVYNGNGTITMKRIDLYWETSERWQREQSFISSGIISIQSPKLGVSLASGGAFWNEGIMQIDGCGFDNNEYNRAHSEVGVWWCQFEEDVPKCEDSYTCGNSNIMHRPTLRGYGYGKHFLKSCVPVEGQKDGGYNENIRATDLGCNPDDDNELPNWQGTKDMLERGGKYATPRYERSH